MANTDNPHGFIPHGELLHVGYYAVPTAPTINTSIGDIVMGGTANIVSKKLGLGIDIYHAAVIGTTPAATYALLGAVVGCFDENMNPIQYIAAARIGDSTVSGYVAVADDPNQEFEAQTDGELTDTGFELNYEITSIATTNAPNSRTGLSRQEITGASGADVGETIPIRLIKQLTPDDSHASAGCRIVCQINPLCHRYGLGTVPS